MAGASAAVPPALEGNARRTLPGVLLLLALAGLAVAIDLWVIHQRAHAGAGPSFCDIDEHVSCGKVALSSWSILLGAPLAAWGALAYLAVGGLAAWALPRRRPGPSWPAGLLVLLTGLMSAGAVFLAVVSELVIHAFCIMCACSWVISLALLGGSLLLARRRAGGSVAAVRADLRTLRVRPLPAAAGGAVLVALAAGLLVAYRLAPVPQLKVPQVVAGAPGAEPVVVYVYSDYLCPYCARMHLVEKAISASSPGVRFVRRHYPLDGTCNPRIRETIHAGSCELARGGICAERLGAFDAYDDAAFANQDAKPTPQAVASMVGIDPSAFEACLHSPETDARLAADIQSGTAAGVHATPSFQVQGRLYTGQLPPVLGGAGAGGE